ncbi:MAG: class I adenylate-forming enzyme family protein, partial [Acidimicrobiales bacterium]
ARAGWLLDAGVEPGVRVAACARNDPEVVVLFLACMRIGAVWVGLAPALSGTEKVARLEDAGVTFVLVDPEQRQALETVLATLPADKTPSLLEFHGADADADADADWWDPARSAELPADVDPMKPAAIAYTSGSTGAPKGVVHCQEAIATATEALGRLYPDGLRHGACLALTTLNMLMASALVALATQGTCAVTDRREPKELAAWIRREEVQTFPAVLTLLYDLVADPDVEAEDLASLIRPALGGMAVEPEFCDRFRARFGHEVSVGYGLSEGPCTVARRLPSRHAPKESVGQALPHVSITIRDDEGRVLPPDAVGEICVGARTTGPWANRYVPMLGYWGQPTLAERVLRDGVLHTGDLGRLDEDDNLFIGGRLDETIKRAGSNIPAGRVEAVVMQHRGVRDCVALGMPDPRVGERIVVAFEAEEGSHVSAADLVAFSAQDLAPFERPDRFVQLPRLPRTSTEKIARGEVRAMLRAHAADGS